MGRPGTRALSRAAAALLLLAPVAARATTPLFLYYLSDFGGRIRFGQSTVSYDPRHHEAIVATVGGVHFFDRGGMEVFAFSNEDTLGVIEQLVPFTGSDWLARTFHEGRGRIARLDYRGELLEWLEPRGVPPDIASSFRLDRIAFRGGRIYGVDFSRLRVIVLDQSGAFQKGYRLLDILKLSPKQLEDAYLSGWDVSPSGDILFTINPLFTAYVLAPDGTLRSFGTRGSRPGKFNQVGAITADERGTLYVTDFLRCVVMLFDKDFNFLTEFGYRGYDKSSLVYPNEIALGEDDTIYVLQGGFQGVSTFKLLP